MKSHPLNILGLPFGVFLSHCSILAILLGFMWWLTIIIEHSLEFCAYPRGVVC